MTLYLKTAGGNWSSANTWSNVSAGGVDNSGPPASTDNVIFELLSGNCTIDDDSFCRSLDCTSGTGSYTGTLTHNSFTLAIGDNTAGAGNVALKFAAGMTYTKTSTTLSQMLFSSPSATQQTVTTAGKVLGNATFTGTGGNGSWIVSDALTANGSSLTTMTLNSGALDMNGQTVNIGGFNSSNSNVRSLTLGASSITIGSTEWVLTNAVNMTFSAGTSTITVNAFSAGFRGGGLTYNIVIILSSGIPQMTGTNTFATLTRTGAALKTDGLTLTADQTVTGTFTVNSNSSVNRLIVQSNTLGTARTITAGSVVISNIADFQDITGAGAATWTVAGTGATALGDCGGNSGITFTTPATQTATGTASFTWSTHGWTSRVPLPQDNVVVNNAFSASQTITADMPRWGKSVTFGCSGSPTLAQSSNAGAVFGSLDLTGVASWTGSGGMTFSGRGNFLFTSNGTSYPANSIQLSMFGGKITLQDAFNVGVNGITLNNGELDTGGFSITSGNLSSSNSNTRALTLGATTWTLTATGTPWNLATSSGMTLTPGSSTIKFTNTASNSKTFAGGGKTYNNFWYAPSSGTGTLIVSSNNTFADFKDDGSVAHSITFASGTTQTLSTWSVSGTAGNLITINSTTTATHALTKTGGGTINADYLNIQHSVARPWSGASGVDTWFAGAHSTNNQGVATAGSGWIFGGTNSNFFMFF